MLVEIDPQFKVSELRALLNRALNCCEPEKQSTWAVAISDLLNAKINEGGPTALDNLVFGIFITQAPRQQHRG